MSTTENVFIHEGFTDIFVISIGDFEEDDTVLFEKDTATGSLTRERLIPDVDAYDYLGYTIRGSGVRISPGAVYEGDKSGKSASDRKLIIKSASPILRAPLLYSRRYAIEKYFDLPGDDNDTGAYMGFHRENSVATEPEFGLVTFEYNRNRPGFVRARSIFKVVPLAAEFVSGYEVQALDAEFRILRGDQLYGDDIGCPRPRGQAFGFKWAVDLYTLQTIDFDDWDEWLP